MDLSEIPEPLLKLVMHDWFDKNDTIIDNKERIDSNYVRVVGNNLEQIKSRINLLQMHKRVRNGGGVRIKEVKR